MHRNGLHKIYFLLLFIGLCYFNNAQASNNSIQAIKPYIEAVAETNKTSELYGLHFITYINQTNKHWKHYFGGGLVHVNLTDNRDSFTALHAVTGTDFMFTKHIGITTELGFDLGEEIISGQDDRGNPTVGGDVNNQVDINIAFGVILKPQKHLYLKAYVRRHFFDGVFLPDTYVTFVGVRLGFAF